MPKKGDMEASNHRRHLRVQSRLPAVCYRVPRDEEPVQPLDVTVLDVSVGGVLLETPVRLPLRERVVLRLEVAEPALDLTAAAKVVRIDDRSDARERRYLCGLRFEALEARTSAALVRFVFARARTLAGAAQGAPA